MSCRSFTGSSIARAASWRTFVNVPSTTSRAMASMSWSSIAALSASSSWSATKARSGTVGSGSTASTFSDGVAGAAVSGGALRKKREKSDIVGLQLSITMLDTYSTGSYRAAHEKCGRVERAVRNRSTSLTGIPGGCMPYHARHRVGPVVNRIELLGMRQQHLRHRQRAGLASSAQTGILDAFKV